MSTAKPNAETQFMDRGYVLDEEAEYRLRNLADAMRGIAHLTEGDLAIRDMPEMPARWVSAIFIALADNADAIRTNAAFSFGPIPTVSRKRATSPEP